MKKCLLGLVFVSSLGACLLLSEKVEASSDMYRMYNPSNGEHFFTKDVGERDSLQRAGWKYEGVGWTAPDFGYDVFRLYNPKAGDHHYTMNYGERLMLVRSGWKFEGVGWYSDTNKMVPIHRAYNSNAKTGSHNYTASISEHNFLLANGWKHEGIGWYGVDVNRMFNVTIRHETMEGNILKIEQKQGKYEELFVAEAQDFIGYVLVTPHVQKLPILEDTTIVFKYYYSSGTKLELADLYNQCTALSEANYTKDSWQYFKSTLDKTAQILQDTTVTKDEIDTQYQNLLSARDNLVPVK